MTADVKELTARARGGSPPPPLTPARGLRGITDALGRLGWDVEDLLAAARLSSADIEDPDAQVPCSAPADVLGRAQQRRPTKNLALRLAAATPMGAYPLLDYVVLSSDTVGDAYRQLGRYLPLVGSPLILEFDERTDPVRVVMSSPGNVFALEYTLSLSVFHLRRETGNQLRVRSVHFAHRPDDAAEYERELRCRVETEGGWSGVSLDPDSWRLPLSRRDPVLHGILERQAEEARRAPSLEDTHAGRVRRLLASRVAGGDVRIETVARQMAASPRTLQRRLAAEGTAYQDVLDGVRREAAESYLTDSELSAGEIGYLLGYSEPAAFHRAFRRWAGMTPSEWRRDSKGGAIRKEKNSETGSLP